MMPTKPFVRNASVPNSPSYPITHLPGSPMSPRGTRRLASYTNMGAARSSPGLTLDHPLPSRKGKEKETDTAC